MAYQDFNQPLYLEGTEAFANHNLLNNPLFSTANAIDMDFGTFLQDENPDWSTQSQVHDISALNGGPPQTLEPQVSDNAFTNPSAAQLYAESNSVYPDPTALESSLPYYGNYAPLNNVTQSNPQLQNSLRQSFIPPRPLIQHGSQFFQNTQTDLDSRFARDDEEMELLRAHRLRKAQQADQPAASSRQTSPKPAVTDSAPFKSPVPSPTFGEVSRVSWNRNHIKERDPKCNPTNFYTDPLPKPEGWCPNTKGQPRITYTDAGQWAEHLLFTKDQLHYYLENCPRRLRLWVQNHPSQSNHRTDHRYDRKCRYKSCIMPGRTIKNGFFRVAFDEFPELTCKGKKDPMKVAGVMHLYCFEQIADPAVFHRRGMLKHDDRTLLREDKNPMSLTRDAADRLMVDEAFRPWMAARQEVVQLPRPHPESLSYCLTKYHVDHQTNTRQSARNQRNAKRRRCELKSMEIHMGDLSVFVKADRRRKNRAAKHEEEEEDEVEEVEVQAAPPTPPADSNSLDNSGTDFLLQGIDLTVPPTEFTTSLIIDPLANPNFGPLDSLPAFDDFSVDFSNGCIDPLLQASCEPSVKEGDKPVDENDSAKVDGIMTPRSLSHLEDNVDVQNDNAPASACSESGSLFGSPTASKPSSPKAKSPTKKRKRDDDDEYSPTSASKRTRSQTLASSEGRRRSSTRSLRSCRKSP